jgi:hypothetical protein
MKGALQVLNIAPDNQKIQTASKHIKVTNEKQKVTAGEHNA